MKKRIILFFVSTFILFSNTVTAALPPLAQSLKEIDRVVSHDIFRSNEMIAEQIVKIERTDDGFIVETTNFTIPFSIKYLDQEVMGPVEFCLELDIDKLIVKD